MKISQIVSILDCEVMCDTNNMDATISSACGADLMSDVLAFAKDSSVLLTGMVNQHVIRTAEMLDVLCIVFVRGKAPTKDICELAKSTGVALLKCDHTLYEACGLLYKEGLPPCARS